MLLVLVFADAHVEGRPQLRDKRKVNIDQVEEAHQGQQAVVKLAILFHQISDKAVDLAGFLLHSFRCVAAGLIYLSETDNVRSQLSDRAIRAHKVDRVLLVRIRRAD